MSSQYPSSPRAHEEAAAHEHAIRDVLSGRTSRVPPGHGAIAYFIAFSLATRMLPYVQEDVERGRYASLEDPDEQRVYDSLYRALQQPPVAQTAETIRLRPTAPTPRQTGRCPDCQGGLQPIRILERGHNGHQHDLEYTAVDARPSFWTGTIPSEGRIEPFLCTACGRILLYGRPSES